jgi:hypothetical protein
MNNSQLAFELLRIHLGKHDVPPDIESLRLAIDSGLVVCSGMLLSLTYAGIAAVDRVTVGLSDGMVAK